MKRILTGITPSNELTIGNYIGAIKQILVMQENPQNETFLFIADLHALTNPITPKELKETTLSHIKIYLAAGVDPKKVKMFLQSSIYGHTELCWYLTINTSLGQLSRLTQFKDKSQKQKNKTESIPTGLLMYPVLMAADILLYNANIIPLGKDQTQHMEIARDLAEKMNKKYKTNLVVPEIKTPKAGAKIMALKEPTKKMSKSDDNSDNTIFLLDDEKALTRKIMTALTDSENKVYYDVEKKPGVSNLITIYAAMKGIELKKAESELKDLDYKSFKEAVLNVVLKTLLPLQKKYYQITEKDVKKALNINKDYIQKEAEKTLGNIKEKMGFIYE